MTKLFVVWGDINKTGITIIDEQHRGIACILNSTFWLMGEGHGATTALPIIKMMLQYSHVHFLSEEYLLQKARWPGLVKHAPFHREFMTRLNLLTQEFKQTGDYKKILQYLKEWWTDHINVQDKQYAEYLKKVLPEYHD